MRTPYRMKLQCSRRMVLSIAWSVLFLPAVAAAGPPIEQQDDRQAPDSAVQTQQSIAVDEGELRYAATAGSLRVRLDESEAEAAIFYVSYHKEEEDPRARPITFVFNGGPGSSAAWLHLGGLGPRRLFLSEDGAIRDAPARLIDNPQTWLRFTDLVFVDPVGTGFSRALVQPGKEGRNQDGRAFWGIKSDLRALAEFMRLYLTRHARWASPKYLAGESYGGFRAAALVEVLPIKAGIELSGAVLISPVIEYSLNLGSDYLNVMPWITFVPSYAACAFYHGRYRAEGPATLQEVAADAEEFGRTELLLALASGSVAGSRGAGSAYEHLAAITGLGIDEVRRQRGRIPAEIFAKRLLEDEGRVVGIYDGSVSAPDPSPFSTNYPARDPSLDPLTAPVMTTLNAYVREELGYKTDLRYELVNEKVLRAWDWAEAGGGDLPGVGSRLRSGLSVNPRLKVLVAHGYFDLATPYFGSKYVIERLELDEERFPNLALRVYAGGHMFYIRSEAREQLYQDARAMYGSGAREPSR